MRSRKRYLSLDIFIHKYVKTYLKICTVSLRAYGILICIYMYIFKHTFLYICTYSNIYTIFWNSHGILTYMYTYILRHRIWYLCTNIFKHIYHLLARTWHTHKCIHVNIHIQTYIPFPCARMASSAILALVKILKTSALQSFCTPILK